MFCLQCETCHGAGAERTAQAPFARLALPLPGLVPPPTSAPTSFVEARMRGRGLTSEAAINVNVPGAINPAPTPAPARATEATDAQQARPPTQQPPPNVQVVRRVPPVVTVHDLADLLADSSDVIARIMPTVASAADVVRNLEARRLDGTLGTVPSNDGTTASAQREMLRTSMTLHSAGSLLMELARLTSSVHVNGAASDPPQFMSNFARQHEQTMRREQQAQAAAGTTATTPPSSIPLPRRRASWRRR